jgi:hypothetical protein
MPSASFTPEELGAFARQHVTYEVGASANLTVSWYYSQLTSSRQVQSALMSATLVHLRLLADFLHRAPRGDDVAATHYVDTWERTTDPLGVERSEIDGHVAHLTMRRRTRRTWDLVQLAWAVFLDLERFLRAVEATDFSDDFDECRDLATHFRWWSDTLDGLPGELEPIDLDGIDRDWYRRLPMLPVQARGS